MAGKSSTNSSDWNSSVKTVLVILALSFAYAIIRYHVLKGVSWGHFPLYIGNKAVSLAAVATISLSYLLGPLCRFFPRTFVPRLGMRMHLGLLGFSLAALHALMSLLLFNPAYYPSFFEAGGKMSVVGELSMLFGVLSFLVFASIPAISHSSLAAGLTREKWQQLQRSGYAALFIVALHLLVMGYSGWLKPSGWPAGLLPISLIAFSTALFAILLRIIVMVSPARKPS